MKYNKKRKNKKKKGRKEEREGEIEKVSHEQSKETSE